MPITRHALAGTMALIALLGPLAPAANACTRILWNDNKLAVVAGRTMDFPVSTEPIITVLPHGTRWRPFRRFPC
jgi:penicillin V acylase-like amidase (Ntn superfamily)